MNHYPRFPTLDELLEGPPEVDWSEEDAFFEWVEEQIDREEMINGQVMG